MEAEIISLLYELHNYYFNVKISSKKNMCNFHTIETDPYFNGSLKKTKAYRYFCL